MAKKAVSSNSKWITPASFQDIEDKTLSFIIGNAKFTISDMQLHIHQIDTPTKSHSHHDYQIIYYTKGTGTQHISRKKHEVTPASIFFVPPEKTHKFVPNSGSIAQAFTMLFSIDFEENHTDKEEISGDVNRLIRLLYSKKFEAFKLNADELKVSKNLINNLQKELTAKDFGYILAAKGYLLLLLRKFLQAGIKQESDNSPLSRKQLIFLKSSEFIRKNRDRKITLKSIAKRFHVSESYIQKIYREYAGMPITNFIHQMKMDKAAHLLKKTDMPIKQIAYECGMGDRNYFTRTFKKIFDATPRQYRIKES